MLLNFIYSFLHSGIIISFFLEVTQNIFYSYLFSHLLQVRFFIFEDKLLRFVLLQIAPLCFDCAKYNQKIFYCHENMIKAVLGYILFSLVSTHKDSENFT